MATPFSGVPPGRADADRRLRRLPYREQAHHEAPDPGGQGQRQHQEPPHQRQHPGESDEQSTADRLDPGARPIGAAPPHPSDVLGYEWERIAELRKLEVI